MNADKNIFPAMQETETHPQRARSHAREHCLSPGLISDPEMLAALARDNAQIAADFIWAGNRAAAREHLQRALEQLSHADAATDQVIEVSASLRDDLNDRTARRAVPTT